MFIMRSKTQMRIRMNRMMNMPRSPVLMVLARKAVQRNMSRLTKRRQNLRMKPIRRPLQALREVGGG